MALQKVFKKSYLEYLKTHINVADYLQDTFPYDETQTLKLYAIEQPWRTTISMTPLCQKALPKAPQHANADKSK